MMGLNISLLFGIILGICYFLDTTYAYSQRPRLVGLVTPSSLPIGRYVRQRKQQQYHRQSSSLHVKNGGIGSGDYDRKEEIDMDSSTSSIGDDRGENDEDSISSWRLEQDWALIDQLPHFTVGENDQIRTFWTQLVTATPLLSDKDINDVQQRCQELANEQSSLTAGDIPRRPPQDLIFGPSPPIIQNWDSDVTIRRLSSASLSTTITNNDGKMVGQTEDGRTIWLRYYCIGRLKGDPFNDGTNDCWMMPGGYLEAIGGRIYELGQPSSNVANRGDHQQQIPSSLLSPSPIFQSSSSSSSDNWMQSKTATISALLASTILSACIGYGTGLSASIPSSELSTSIPPCPYANTGKVVTIRTTSSGSIITASPSISEQRAGSEYRVYREQRLLQQISNRLEKNEVELDILRQQEQVEITNMKSSTLSP